MGEKAGMRDKDGHALSGRELFDPDASGLLDALAAIPGVEAVALGGSRATGTARPDSDWDFGLYYRGRIHTDAIRAMGFPGSVVEPGEWGRLVNGGAWLEIEGTRVDLLYRDIAFVERWTAEAAAGRYERDHVEGYIAGMTTYVLVGELALNRTLRGTLPKPEFSAALATAAPPRWFSSAAFSLDHAEAALRRDDQAFAVGLLAKALIAESQGILAGRREWALNEKRITERAGLTAVAAQIAAPGIAVSDVMLAARESLAEAAAGRE